MTTTYSARTELHAVKPGIVAGGYPSRQPGGVNREGSSACLLHHHLAGGFQLHTMPGLKSIQERSSTVIWFLNLAQHQAGNWTMPLKQGNRETWFELSNSLSVSYHGACQNKKFCCISRPCFVLAVILYELLHFYQLCFLGFERQKKKKKFIWLYR